MIRQLYSEAIVIVTETWMSEEQSLNISFSTKHNYMHKSWSHQTGAAKVGDVVVWIPKKISIKRIREFDLADPRSFEKLRLELVNTLAEKCLINVSYCPHQSLGDFFLHKLSAEVSKAFSNTDNILLFGDYTTDRMSINGQKSHQNCAAGLELQLSNIDFPTSITSMKEV